MEIKEVSLFDQIKIINILDKILKYNESAGIDKKRRIEIKMEEWSMMVKTLEDNLRLSGVNFKKYHTIYKDNHYVIYGMDKANGIPVYGVLNFKNNAEVCISIEDPEYSTIFDFSYCIFGDKSKYETLVKDVDSKFGVASSIKNVKEANFKPSTPKEMYYFMTSKIKNFKIIDKDKFLEISNLMLNINMLDDNEAIAFVADAEHNVLLYDVDTGNAYKDSFKNIDFDSVLLVYSNLDFYEDTFDSNLGLIPIENGYGLSGGNIVDLSDNVLYKEDLQGAFRKASKVPRKIKDQFLRLEKKLRRSISESRRIKEDKTREELINNEVLPVADEMIEWLASISVGYGTFAVGLLNPVLAIAVGMTLRVVLKNKTKKKRERAIAFLKDEIEMIDEKIGDTKIEGDKAAKYNLMRIKNDLTRRLDKIRAM